MAGVAFAQSSCYLKINICDVQSKYLHMRIGHLGGDFEVEVSN
jgi:hypothetical protein